MTHFEFETLTMVNVNVKEFDAINTVYMNSDLGKDEFCKMWCKMNKSRVEQAKHEREIQKREKDAKDCLWAWFNKWAGTQKYYDNYHTPIYYTRLTCKQISAMSYANIMLEGSLSDVHYKVGEYLGYYK